MFHLGGRARREDRAQALLAPAYLVASSTGMVLMPYLDARPDLATFAKLPGRTGRWLGVALVGLGCAVQVWAMRSLGPWFIPRVAILEDHDLVQAGPYRFVRHPFYAGLVSASLGLPLAFGLWTGVPAVAVSVPLLLNRITAEERLLAEEFGEAFTELTTRTWRLVPYVY